MIHHYLYSFVDLATQEEEFDLVKGEDTYLVTHPWLKCYGSKQRVLSGLQLLHRCLQDLLPQVLKVLINKELCYVSHHFPVGIDSRFYFASCFLFFMDTLHK